MTLVRYNPLNDFLPRTFGDLIESTLNVNGPSTYAQPLVDIFKTDKHYELHITAPGMDKGDFTVDVDNHRLTIKGERKLEEEKRKSLIKREASYGKFKRVFKLSDEIESAAIKADYENGILKITLPLDQKKAQRRTISIN